MIDDEALREWMYAWEVMRRLGFAAEDLYFLVTRNSGCRPIVHLQLQAQGKEFVWTIGETTIPYDDLQGAYEATCAAWNQPEVPGRTIDSFFASQAFAQRWGLMTALTRKGLVLPSLERDPWS